MVFGCVTNRTVAAETGSGAGALDWDSSIRERGVNSCGEPPPPVALVGVDELAVTAVTGTVCFGEML